MRKTVLIILLLIVASAATVVWQLRWSISGVEVWMAQHKIEGMVAYTLFAAGSIVLLPFTSLPFLPIAARLFGVGMTAVLSITGWWIGCLIAFAIARAGRDAVGRLISLNVLDSMEQKIPRDIGFAGIVVLRMLFPVDIISFALGFLKHLSFGTYATASLLGMIPFAFVWSYGAGQLSEGEIFSSLLVFAGMTVAVTGMRKYVKK